MASTADQLSALGTDASFRLRVQALLMQHARVVYAEAPGTPDTRRLFAKAVIANPVSYSASVALSIANSTNVVAGTTSYDFATGHIKTDVTDAALSSQISTDWNMLAGV